MISAMVCLLAAAASISVGTATEEGAVDESGLNAVDEVSMTDDVDEMNNATSLNSTNQSSNESFAENVADMGAFDLADEELVTDDVSEVNNVTPLNLTDQPSNESFAEDVIVEDVDIEALDVEAVDMEDVEAVDVTEVDASVVGLSTLDKGSETADDADVTVIRYMPPSNETDVVELAGMEETDVRVLGDVLGAPAAETVADLSTLGEGSQASGATDGAEPMDVRVLGNVLGAPDTENVANLSTLSQASTKLDTGNATKISYMSPSNATTAESETTDVKVLSGALGY
ncbi:MAG TPA: hypothetical protein PLM24_02425 [Methanothrix sp.]|nr:hypothetical protein [Methanothrix sp.]